MTMSKPIIITSLAFASVLAAIVFVVTQTGPKGKPPTHAEAPLPPQSLTVQSVSVTPASVGASQTRVSGYGEAKPKYSLTLSAQVSGQIHTLSEQFVSGQVVQEGQVLAQVDKTEYQLGLASAKAALAQADLGLQEEQRENKQAQTEWKSSRVKGTPLVLREPHLKAAQKAIQQAQQQVTLAQRNVGNTSIKSPFNALIVERHIQPGSVIQTGSPIATLYSTDVIEIRVPIASKEWLKLPSASTLSKQYWLADLQAVDGDAQWLGKVTRIEQHINSKTRERALVITVNNPLKQNPPLLPGTFLRASIHGKTYNSLWRIPNTALTQSESIWYVDKNNTLQKINAVKIYDQNEHTFITPIPNIQSSSIVVRPLNSYVQGMHVEPRLEG